MKKVILVLLMAIFASGCMQLTGAQSIKWGSFEIVSNAGFEVSAGAMQYDGANNLKTKNRSNKSGDRY